ncbi:hypothetical protein PR202_ga22635 [Eleusine coracana subsp. coracana]|uniref:DNA2/NAM7 helicase helicase domain-containing protein n=1 Tax=Eleusine coracana subsp. coracana TaxID=191504 RepID=A0AAV5D289_ELECO|nr:hypothetical protein PR202_ga22635 [Eleusine coracana subsp. coracana]
MEASGSASGGTRSRKGRNRKKGERSRGGGSADEPHDTAGGGAVQARPRAGEQSNAGVVGGLNGDDGGRNGKEAATAGEEGSAAEPHWSHDADGDTVQATPPRAGEQSSAGGRREVLNGATEQERLLLDGDQALPLGDHHGEQAPGPGEGQRRRRREKRNRKKMSKGDTAGEGSASEPHGSRDGDTAGGHAVQAAPQRAGEQTTGGGGRGGLNGEANQEEPKTGRNDRVEEERPDLGRVQPLQVQSDDQQLGDEGGLDGEAGKEERRSLDGGLAPQLVDHHHQQQGAGGGHNGNTEPESLLLGVPMPGGDGAAGSNGSPARRRVVPSQEDGAREEGDGPGRAAAMTSRQLAAGAVEPATPIASPSMSLPKCTFLSEALLSWTVADVLDENFYKHKYQLELSDILSHENEMSIAAIQGVIELDKKVTKLGKSCAESTGCNVVWTPLGSTSKYIVDEVKEFVKSKKNVLICLPALIDDSYTLAEALNRTRMSCLKLMGSLTDSLQLPNPKNRDELDKFCLKHYNIIVTTVDCTWKLLDMEMVPFDVLFVLGANQIKEAELLVPFHHPVKHTILFGDPYHLKPIIQSEMCKDAGYSASIFDKLQQMFPEAVLMLKDQSSMHPLVSKFPNDYFTKGNLKMAAM